MRRAPFRRRGADGRRRGNLPQERGRGPRRRRHAQGAQAPRVPERVLRPLRQTVPNPPRGGRRRESQGCGGGDVPEAARESRDPRLPDYRRALVIAETRLYAYPPSFWRCSTFHSPMWSARRSSDFFISDSAARTKSSMVILRRFPRRRALRMAWRTTLRIEPPESAYLRASTA